MRKILILGAGGQIARWVIDMLADDDTLQLTLFLRHTGKLRESVPKNAQVVRGDVLNMKQLNRAMVGQDLVYANLAGEDIDTQAENIVKAMKTAKVRRLIFVASLGIYDEVPGKFGAWNRRQISDYLPPFRRAADVIEASGLDTTILRPAWLTDKDEVDYETTGRDEPFKGTEVSRKSVAALIAKIIDSPTRFERRNLGVNKPGTDGDKPAFV
ncbi:MAG TPA: SDR family oxidoreductase [Acidobacteriaceae bacterium]|nr:SDR family oxidoreductase [Acidobacteriaceae bacterium]